MIDMQPSDYSCIFSTMQFISEQAKKYDRTLILTFYQPLYWKAKEIQMWESENINLKDVKAKPV